MENKLKSVKNRKPNLYNINYKTQLKELEQKNK